MHQSPTIPLTTLALASLTACLCINGVPHAVPLLTVSPPAVDFGAAYVGARVTRTVRLEATGGVPVALDQVTLACPGAPFALAAGAPDRVEPGAAVDLVLTYAPKAVGDHACRLRLVTDAEDLPEALVPLSGRARATPDCPPDPNPCALSRFDPQAGRCASIPSDGGRCDDGSPCTVDDACRDGRCAGTYVAQAAEVVGIAPLFGNLTLPVPLGEGRWLYADGQVEYGPGPRVTPLWLTVVHIGPDGIQVLERVEREDLRVDVGAIIPAGPGWARLSGPPGTLWLVDVRSGAPRPTPLDPCPGLEADPVVTAWGDQLWVVGAVESCVYDASTPGAPAFLARVPHGGDLALSTTQHLWLGDAEGTTVLDPSDPGAPRVVAALGPLAADPLVPDYPPARSQLVAAPEGYRVYAALASGVAAFDTSTGVPVEVARVAGVTGRVALTRSALAVGPPLRLLDPETLQPLGASPSDLAHEAPWAAAGNLMIAGSGVWDLSAPSAPVRVASDWSATDGEVLLGLCRIAVVEPDRTLRDLDHPELCGPGPVVLGPTGLLSLRHDRLRTFDVSRPEAPRAVQTAFLSGPVDLVSVGPEWLPLTQVGVRPGPAVHDLRDPAAPVRYTLPLTTDELRFVHTDGWSLLDVDHRADGAWLVSRPFMEPEPGRPLDLGPARGVYLGDCEEVWSVGLVAAGVEGPRAAVSDSCPVGGAASDMRIFDTGAMREIARARMIPRAFGGWHLAEDALLQIPFQVLRWDADGSTTVGGSLQMFGVKVYFDGRLAITWGSSHILGDPHNYLLFVDTRADPPEVIGRLALPPLEGTRVEAVGGHFAVPTEAGLMMVRPACPGP